MTDNTPSFPVAGPLLPRSPESAAKRFSAAGPAAVVVTHPTPAASGSDGSPARATARRAGAR